MDASLDDRVSSTILGSLMTLTSDHISRILCRNISPTLFELGIPNSVCVYASWILSHNALTKIVSIVLLAFLHKGR